MRLGHHVWASRIIHGHHASCMGIMHHLLASCIIHGHHASFMGIMHYVQCLSLPMVCHCLASRLITLQELFRPEACLRGGVYMSHNFMQSTVLALQMQIWNTFQVVSSLFRKIHIYVSVLLYFRLYLL